MSESFSLKESVYMNGIHKKLISAIAFAPSGARFASASFDNTVKLWHFSGMQKNVNYFRKMVPIDGIPIHSLEWNKNGSKLLVCPSTNISVIYDRDGKELTRTPKGDMYLKDLNNTIGHISQINGGCWDKQFYNNRFITWGNDGTVRLG